MSEKKHRFPEEKFGPKLLKLLQELRKTKCDKWGPDISGVKLSGKGLNWVIVSSSWGSFTAVDTDTNGFTGRGRFSWTGKFMDAEEDFDL